MTKIIVVFTVSVNHRSRTGVNLICFTFFVYLSNIPFTCQDENNTAHIDVVSILLRNIQLCQIVSSDSPLDWLNIKSLTDKLQTLAYICILLLTFNTATIIVSALRSNILLWGAIFCSRAIFTQAHRTSISLLRSYNLYPNSQRLY